MVAPDDVARVLNDAARLVGRGEIVVFGSAALASWLRDAPHTRDVDLLVDPPERGEVVEALMGELSWYHERHGAYVEVSPPSTFCAPASWRTRARSVRAPDGPDVEIVVAHPHDVLVAKLERFEVSDREHAARILREVPLTDAALTALADETAYRRGGITDPARKAAFETHLAQLRALLPR